jgi:hypothetical protein
MEKRIHEARFFRTLTKKYNLDANTIRRICRYPFKFVRQCIKDVNCYEEILLAEFGRFYIKKEFKHDKTPTPHAIHCKRLELSLKKKELWLTDPIKYKELYGDWSKKKLKNETKINKDSST